MNEITYVVDMRDGSNIMSYNFSTVRNQLNDTVMTMRFSPTDMGWTEKVRGHLCLKWKDHGNGVKVTFNNGKKIKLHYDELEELYLMMRYRHEDSETETYVPNVRKFIEVK